MNIFEAIIELLIANIAFVVIAAGGLYSFFKRLNDNKNTNRPAPVKRSNEHPKQQTSPFGVPIEANREPEKRETMISPDKGPERSEAINSRYKDLKQKSISNRYQDKEEAILGSFRADQKELQKAVVWSEILSKPKALQKRM